MVEAVAVEGEAVAVEEEGLEVLCWSSTVSGAFQSFSIRRLSNP